MNNEPLSESEKYYQRKNNENALQSGIYAILLLVFLVAQVVFDTDPLELVMAVLKAAS